MQLLIVLYSDTNYVLEGFVAEYFVTPCLLSCPNLKDCTGETKCDCVIEEIFDNVSNETACGSIESLKNETSTQLQQYSTNNLLLQRVGHSAIRHNSRLYIYGGFDLNVILNDLIVVDLTEAESSYTNLKVQNGEVWPSVGHFGHASASYLNGFFIHGGRTPNGISNDLFYFDVVRKEWIDYTNDQLPRLMYHSMTEGSNGIFYVYGGGSPNGSFSNQLYKFHGETPGKWDLISSNCCGKVKERSILGHTMNYWPNKNILILFGGLVSDVGRFSKLSTQLWIYLIDSNTWIPIEYKRPPSEQNTERAFATSQVIANHLVVVGGVRISNIVIRRRYYH